MMHFLKYQAPAIAVALAIFILSSFSKIPAPPLGFEMQDKLLHFIAYSVVGYLFARAFFFQNRYPAAREHFVAVAIIAGVLYGLSDEVHQYFVPGSYMELGDFIADALGVIFSVFLFKLRIGKRVNA